MIWDLKTGTTASPPIPEMKGHGPVEWISPESRFVMTRGSGIKLWEIRGGGLRLDLQEDWRQPLAVKTDDGAHLPNPVVTADGKRLLSFYGPPREASPKALKAPVPGRAGSAPVDPWIATSLRLHEIESGRLLFEMGFAGMTFVGLVPGSDMCVCEAADGTIAIRDLKTGKELRRVTLRPIGPPRIASPNVGAKPPPPRKPQLTPDGKRVVKSIVGGGFVLFDLASGAEVARFKPSENSVAWWYERLVLAPSGRTAAVHFQRDVYLWTIPGQAAAASPVAARKPEAPLVRELAGTATAVSVGGAGRYLLLTLRDVRQLAVFDVNAADIVKSIPLASDKVLVAAGASKFVVAYPETGRIERWDLGTLAREGDPQPLPFDGTLEAIALGADSEGPMLAAWSFPDANPALKDRRYQRFSFVDLARFKVLAVVAIAVHGNGAAGLAASGGDFEPSHRGRMTKTGIRASYDGSLFGIGGEVALKAEAGAVIVSQDASVPSMVNTPVYMIPSPDGRRVFHGRTGIRDAVFFETPFQLRGRQPAREESLLRLPSADPRLDISLRTADTITLLGAEDGTRLLTVGGLDEMAGVLQQGDIVRDGISLENRYHLVPAARLLVTIPFDQRPPRAAPRRDRPGPRTLNTESLSRKGRNRACRVSEIRRIFQPRNPLRYTEKRIRMNVFPVSVCVRVFRG